MSRACANPLTDVIRALQRLQPQNDAAFRSIVRLLGYTLMARGTGQPHATLAGRPPKSKRPVSRRSSAMQIESKHRTRKPVASELTVEIKAELAPPDWLRTVPHLDTATPSEIRTRLPLPPLFRPNWTRAILSDALSTAGFGGEIDVDRIIREISVARPLTDLPRRQAPTLIRGVQLLVDCSEAMEPFAGDQTALKSAVYRVVGRDKTQSLSFQANPLWGAGSGLRDEWHAYDPPPPGTPVLALTDLGIGDHGSLAPRADGRDWLEFADLLREYGCPLMAFVPYPENRWPEALKKAMSILQWDRPTNAGAVRRVIGRALGIQKG